MIRATALLTVTFLALIVTYKWAYAENEILQSTLLNWQECYSKHAPAVSRRASTSNATMSNAQVVAAIATNCRGLEMRAVSAAFSEGRDTAELMQILILHWKFATVMALHHYQVEDKKIAKAER